MRLRSSEKNGIILLLFLLVCLFVVPPLFHQQKQPFFLLAKAEMDSTGLHEIPVKQQEVEKVELNSADSIALIRIKGIGPYYASRILRYREQLGGFHSVGQIKELNLTYLEVDSISHLLWVDPAKIIRQELDTMSFRSVLRHPYLEYEDVVLIFQARKKWGKVTHALLEEKKVLVPYKLRKIKPYFK